MYICIYTVKLTPNKLLKLLSDPTRLRSVMLLLDEGEVCVCELTHALNEIQPKVSRHLASLRDGRIVTDRRAGQWIYYSLDPKLPAWAMGILHSSRIGMESDAAYKAVLQKLANMPNRPGNRACA